MKKLMYIMICVMLSAALFGCSTQTADTDAEQTAQMDEYLESIEEYFPTDGTYRSYHGYSESSFEVVYYDFEQNDKMTVYKYIGAMNDERMSEEGERTFIVEYTVADGQVVEHVENSDSLAESENNVYSKIQDMIVLSGDIEVGNSWEQEVVLDGNIVTAVTEITEVTDDSFKTVTTAEADSYADGVYTEERTYTKGVGLISFSNTPYGSDVDDTLIFGYAFSVGGEESITGLI
ncbi:MAG: hypothetical protein LUE88_04615 [Clostridiales bacterium]|nr:hypothetical protein [Clostridiales bacterium]